MEKEKDIYNGIDNNHLVKSEMVKYARAFGNWLLAPGSWLVHHLSAASVIKATGRKIYENYQQALIKNCYFEIHLSLKLTDTICKYK